MRYPLITSFRLLLAKHKKSIPKTLENKFPTLKVTIFLLTQSNIDSTIIHLYLDNKHEEDPKPYDPYVKARVLNETMVLLSNLYK